MSPDILREGAILVADAHCAPWRTPFIDFLKGIEEGRIETPQLILMGDIFDLLFGPVAGTRVMNEEGIDLINRLSHRIEILYLEGNHDFCLHEFFPALKVYDRSAHPVFLKFRGMDVALAHGDRNVGAGYGLYSAIIRNRVLLRTLDTIDRLGGGFILSWLEKLMKKKNHCKPISGFDQIALRRMERYAVDNPDIVIEGHFHQNVQYRAGKIHYVNLGAFACNERYFRVQSSDNQLILDEMQYFKELR